MAGPAAMLSGADAETKRITDLIKASGQLRKPKVWPPAKMGPGEKQIAFGISEDHYGRDARWKGGAWTERALYKKCEGPNVNQFGAGVPPQGQDSDNVANAQHWIDYFPPAEHPKEDLISPPDYAALNRGDQSKTLPVTAEVMPWLAQGLAIAGIDPNPWAKANALALMEVAKEETEAGKEPWKFGGGDTEENLKKFAQHYLPVLVEVNPPARTVEFPGLVPEKETAEFVQNKRKLVDGLKQTHALHMQQYNFEAEWVRQERQILRWYATWQKSLKARKDCRKATAPDVQKYAHCPKRYCAWTVCGVEEGPLIPRPAGYDESDRWDNHPYKLKYTVEADRPNGRILKTIDHADDGRGDEGRLDRYKQAYKDHLAFEHTYDPKKAINVKAPTFKTRMTPEEFAEQKEIWRRFQIAYPDDTAELVYDMLLQSIDPELHKIIESEMDQMNNKATEKSVEEIMKTIEKNVVVRIPNEVYMATFDKIRQEEGERVQPYLSRIKSAAAKLEIKRKGTCNPDTHKGVGVHHPCGAAAEWMDAIKTAEAGESQDYISDDNVIEGKTCPPCCKDIKDEERKMWMIKKQFLNNLRVLNHKNQVLMRLQQIFTNTRSESKFDAMKFNIGFMVKVAVQIEEIYERTKGDKPNPPADSAAGRAGGNLPRTKGTKKERGGKQTKTDGSPRAPPGTRTPPTAGAGRNRGITPQGKCTACGEEPHSPKQDGKPANTMEDRKQKCKAYDKDCHKCGKKGHLGKVCRSKAAAAASQENTETETKQGATAAAGTIYHGRPGDHRDWSDENWTRDFGDGHISEEAPLQAAGTTLSTMAGQCLAAATRKCIDDTATGLASEEAMEMKRREMGMKKFIRLPGDTPEEVTKLDLIPATEIMGVDEDPRQETPLKRTGVRKSIRSRTEIGYENSAGEQKKIYIDKSKTKEVGYKNDEPAGNERGGEQEEE